MTRILSNESDECMNNLKLCHRGFTLTFSIKDIRINKNMSGDIFYVSSPYLRMYRPSGHKRLVAVNITLGDQIYHFETAENFTSSRLVAISWSSEKGLSILWHKSILSVTSQTVLQNNVGFSTFTRFVVGNTGLAGTSVGEFKVKQLSFWNHYKSYGSIWAIHRQKSEFPIFYNLYDSLSAKNLDK